MTDLGEFVSVGFEIKPAPYHSPRNDLELRFERAGKADPTRTQIMLRAKSPFRRPEWLQDLQDARRSWRNKTHHVAKLYGVSIVLDPPNPNTSIKEIEHG